MFTITPWLAFSWGRLGDHVAADHRRALTGERQGGGAPHAPAGAGDHANFSRQPAGHLSDLCSGRRSA
jgi:hypothetical protein